MFCYEDLSENGLDIYLQQDNTLSHSSMPFFNPELGEALNADAQIKAYDHLFHVTLTNMSSLTFGTVILQVR